MLMLFFPPSFALYLTVFHTLLVPACWQRILAHFFPREKYLSSVQITAHTVLQNLFPMYMSEILFQEQQHSKTNSL